MSRMAIFRELGRRHSSSVNAEASRLIEENPDQPSPTYIAKRDSQEPAQSDFPLQSQILSRQKELHANS
jgi:hypothetical protein